MPFKNKHPDYGLWIDMNRRCHNKGNKQYPDYGGRGINVCAQWRHSFRTFIADMGPRPEGMSLDRIDNGSGYSPENCRWATAAQQNQNRRSNKLCQAKADEIRELSASGSLTKTQIATMYGVSRTMVRKIADAHCWKSKPLDDRAMLAASPRGAEGEG